MAFICALATRVHILATDDYACKQDEEELETLTQRMKMLLGPFVLRRLKADVAGQLSPKDQRLTQLSMTPIQAEMYTEAVQRLRKQAVAAGLPHGQRFCS